MKKNFLMVASLLIAAMLLVVSCSQEAKAPESNLVEARISVGYGRDLTVNNATDTSDLIYKYTMSYEWSGLDSVSETIYGAKTDETDFTDGGSIGYVTPGLWKINVFAYNSTTDDTGKKVKKGNAIFKGEAKAYFSNQKNSVVVYLSPAIEINNTLSFDITMQDLVGETAGVTSGTGRYELRYSIEGQGDYTGAVGNPGLTGTLTPSANAGTYTSTYKLANDGKVTLKSGFYTVTVSVYSINGDEQKVVGGIRKGFLLSGGATASVTGHIEPSDFENITVDAFYIDVKTKIEASSITYTAASGDVDANAVVTFTVKDNGTSGNKDNITPSYVWYVAENGTTNYTSTNTENFSVTFKAPGYKTVTCQTVYSVQDSVGTKYFFADTQSFQAYVDPTKFGDTTTGPATIQQQTESSGN